VDRLIAHCARIHARLLRSLHLDLGQNVRFLLQNADNLLGRHRLLVRRRLAFGLIRRLIRL
jgi:hypothetical protein